MDDRLNPPEFKGSAYLVEVGSGRSREMPRRDGDGDAPVSSRGRFDVFRALEMAVRSWMLAGRGLSEVEEELIDGAPLGTDEKALLWLLAWSMLPRSYQFAEIEAHIQLLSGAGEGVC
jgi:hypothetical protein